MPLSPIKHIFNINNKKRLLKDIVEIIKKPLISQGIYYKHSDTNLLKGYAMIIGPCDTPYEHGFYFFKFTYPLNYPYSPPKLEYMTNDGHIRFNPNLYRKGKVCLSILNTWRGEQWTSCQTISTILLTLVTVLNETPLLNEPGVSCKHKDFKSYNSIIKWSNYNIAIYDVLSGGKKYKYFITLFEKDIYNYLNIHQDNILAKLLFLKKTIKNQIYTTTIYSMCIETNYKVLYKNIKDILKVWSKLYSK